MRSTFNRWYERDHFPATVTGGPGVFAGARFVATRACKELRPPRAPVRRSGRGSYLAVAWVLARQAGRVGRMGRRRDADDRGAGPPLPGSRSRAHRGVSTAIGRTGDVDAIVALDRGSPVRSSRRRRSAGSASRRRRSTRSVSALERTIISAGRAAAARPRARLLRGDPIADVRARRRMVAGAGFASPFLATFPAPTRTPPTSDLTSTAVKTTLLLCDHAQEVAGKLYVLGGGWSIYRGAPVTMGLAVKIAVPWDAANIPHDFAARLVTEDGLDPVLPMPEGGARRHPGRVPGPVRSRTPGRARARQRARRPVRGEHRRSPAQPRPLRMAGRNRPDRRRPRPLHRHGA